jgi:hypothetical protein
MTGYGRNGSVELLLADDIWANRGKQKSSINILRNPSKLSKTAVMKLSLSLQKHSKLIRL